MTTISGKLRLLALFGLVAAPWHGLAEASATSAAAPAQAPPAPDPLAASAPAPRQAGPAPEPLSVAGETAPAQVTPAPGSRAAAAERLAAGDEAAAIAHCAPLLQGPATEDEALCRVITAHVLLGRRQGAAAAAVIAPALPRLGALAPYGALLHGRGLAEGDGDATAAISALGTAAAADPAGPLGTAAEAPTALALARAGKLAEARARLAPLLAGRRGRAAAVLSLALADAHAAAGDARTAGPLYRKLWREWPGSAAARGASRGIRALRAAGMGAHVPGFGPTDRLGRASRLLGDGKPQLTIRELDKLALELPGPTRDLAARVALLRARATAALGRKAEAEAMLAPCLAAGAPADVIPEALSTGGRLAMRRGDVATAHGRLDRLVREYPDHQLAEEAEFLAAFFAYEAGKYEEAESRFRAYLEGRPTSPRLDDARWYIGFTLYKRQRFREAEQALAELQTALPRSPLVPQAQYWRARALAGAGAHKGANALLRSVSASWPRSWYGLLAANRLGNAPPALPSAIVAGPELPQVVQGALPPRPVLRSPLARARLDRAVALYGAGLRHAAGLELDAALKGERDRALVGEAAALALALGDPGRAYRLAVLRGAGPAELAFPRAFEGEVSSAAAGWGVDPAFVWAIMRRESGFDPAIRSPAAAVGLLQLIPPTARKILRILELHPGNVRRLDDPAINIPLGSWYLAELLGRFQGSYPLAAAAYNAGPKAVTRWLSERGQLPLDEFVESIPYRETRNYVKGVTADHFVYRQGLGAGPPELPGLLPSALPGAEF